MSNILDQIGGISTIKTLVNEFYDVMESDPLAKELRDIHPEKITSARKNFYRFLTHWLGGPEIFGEQYVNAEWLELRHRHVELSEKLVQQWLYCMETAMANLDIHGELKNKLDNSLRALIDDMKLVRNKVVVNN